jgi:bifunctional DNase/RNase
MALVEVEVARLGLDRTSGTYVVILREREGARLLPIWIGQPEAESIVIEMHNMHRERPLTHDLCKNIITHLGATLRRVHITRVASRTYFAELHLASRDGSVLVDARPSDSIALALRFQAPIFANESLLTAGLVEDASSEEIDSEELSGPGASPREEPRPMSADELKSYLENLRPEDFGKFQP